MRSSMLLSLAVGVALLAGCGVTRPVPPTPTDSGPGASDDKKKMQGVWKIASVEAVDERDKMPEKEKAGVRLIFDGDKLSIAEREGRGFVKFSFVVDTTQDPKVIVLTPLDDEGQPERRYAMTSRTVGTSRTIEKAKTNAEGDIERVRWIYKFDGDNLVLAIRKSGGTPTEFKPDAGKRGRFSTSKADSEPYVAPVVVIHLKKTDEAAPVEPKRRPTTQPFRGTSK